MIFKGKGKVEGFDYEGKKVFLGVGDGWELGIGAAGKGDYWVRSKSEEQILKIKKDRNGNNAIT
jgi:hypothetical protein